MPAPRCMRFPPRTGSDRGPSRQRARSSVAWRELSSQRKRLTACLGDPRYVPTILALGAQSETPLTVTLPARASTTFQSTRAGHDDLRSVILLAEDRDLGARLPPSTRRPVMIPRVMKGSFGHSTLVNFTSRRPPR